MKPTARRRRGQRSVQRAKFQDLLAKALKEPGVEEMLKVYEQWKTIDRVARSHRQLLGVKRIVSFAAEANPLT